MRKDDKTHRDDDMGDIAILSDHLESLHCIAISDDIFQQYRSVLLHPTRRSGQLEFPTEPVCPCWSGRETNLENTYHGISYPSASACFAVAETGIFPLDDEASGMIGRPNLRRYKQKETCRKMVGESEQVASW